MDDLIGRYEFSSAPEVVQERQHKYVKWFKPGWKVLDAGSGRGLFLELLRQAGIDGPGTRIRPRTILKRFAMLTIRHILPWILLEGDEIYLIARKS